MESAVQFLIRTIREGEFAVLNKHHRQIVLDKEKEQIENAYDKGFSFGVAMLKQKQEVFVNGEKYYNQNFDNSVVS